MKSTRVVAEPTDLAKPAPKVTLSDDKEKALPIESNLSPERMTEGSSATTAVLSQMLAEQEGFHQLRDWGINE